MASQKKEKGTKQELLPSLPDDLSRLYHLTLFLVSKSFASLLASRELYKTRSLLGCTESCLYVCFQSATKCSWFTLCRKPKNHMGTFQLQPQLSMLLIRYRCPRLLQRLVLISTTSDLPHLLAFRFLTVGLTRGARVQACVSSYRYSLLALLIKRYMQQESNSTP